MSDLELHQSTTQQNEFALYVIHQTNNQRWIQKKRGVYSNEDLLKIAQTTDLNTFIKQQQRNYVNHIVRKDNSSIVRDFFLTIILLQNETTNNGAF